MSAIDTPTADLTPKQHALIVALLIAGDVSTACQEAGVARKSYYRWMALPAFSTALRDAETELLRSTSRRLARLGSKAVEVLEGVLDDPEAPAAVRVRAADSVLSRLLQLRESVGLEERIAAIEEMMKEREDTHGQKR